jgi:IclR family transcriptional regulator, KDG regulon repressor
MVQVLIKAFDILELVAQRNGQPITLTEIADELQLNEATAANINRTLVHRGYLEHIGKKKGYRLGPNAYRLTNEVPYGQDLVNAARSVMEELTAKLNESCLLGVLRNYKRYILHVVNSDQEIQIKLRSERNVYETASGRLLLAYLSEKELERFIQHNDLPSSALWEEGSSKEKLKETLARIKKEGIATTFMGNRDIRGFAVPIIVNDLVVAGLSVFLPEYRCTNLRQQEIIQTLKESAQQIGEKLNL